MSTEFNVKFSTSHTINNNSKHKQPPLESVQGKVPLFFILFEMEFLSQNPPLIHGLIFFSESFPTNMCVSVSLAHTEEDVECAALALSPSHRRNQKEIPELSTTIRKKFHRTSLIVVSTDCHCLLGFSFFFNLNIFF